MNIILEILIGIYLGQQEQKWYDLIVYGEYFEEDGIRVTEKFILGESNDI